MSTLDRAEVEAAVAFYDRDYEDSPMLDALIDAARAWLESPTTEEVELWYWVTPADNPDAFGDYGGFTFQTRKEVEDFIEEWYRLQDTGYYEPDASPDLLTIETVRTIETETIVAARRSREGR